LLADRPIDIEVSSHRIKQLGAATFVIDIKPSGSSSLMERKQYITWDVVEKIALNQTLLHTRFDVCADD